MKKWVKIVLCVLLALLLLAGGYVAYVFIDYHRIGDQMLTPVQSTDAARSVDTNTAYTVVSWNIGFGAYEDDYGFFMDGGTESRAWSKERLTANMDAIAGYLKQQNADFCLLQEVDIGSTRTYRARAAVCRPLQQEQRFLPELRLALSSVSPDRSPRSLPVRPADLLSGEYHRSRPRGAAGGVRLYEASGPGPLLLCQPCPRLRRR